MRIDNAWMRPNITVVEELEVRVCGKLNSSGVTMSGGVTRAGEWLYLVRAAARQTPSSFPGARTDPGGPKFCVYDVI